MSLLLGLVAALAWGIHDLCVRRVSQSVGIFASIVAVLAFGSVLVLPVSIVHWGDAMGPNALRLSLVSGVLFGLAGIALYKAFSIGPVRLVAPIIGAYPILSVGWAMVAGAEVTVLQWTAVGMVIAGVGYIAASGDTDPAIAGPGPAIVWSVLAGAGFAATFAVGQAATAQGGELALLAPTRLAALATVLIIAVLLRVPWRAQGQAIWILMAMGALDAVALGCVISSGQLPNPEFASVAAATFGVVTIVLAALFLKEGMTAKQWAAVALVFSAIGYLAI